MNATKLMRIHRNLADIIENTASKNQIKVTEASREVARLFNQLGKKKIIREIKF